MSFTAKLQIVINRAESSSVSDVGLPAVTIANLSKELSVKLTIPANTTDYSIPLSLISSAKILVLQSSTPYTIKINGESTGHLISEIFAMTAGSVSSLTITTGSNAVDLIVYAAS